MNAAGSPTPPGNPQRVTGALQGSAATNAARRPTGATDGAAFRALLEKLEQRADALGERSRSELTREDLPEAVDEARASMQEALRLSGELLEAWRQSLHQDGEAIPKAQP